MQEILTDGEITLERFRLEDGDLIYQAITESYDEIAKWLSWLTPDYDKKAADEFIGIQLNNWQSDLEYTFTIKNQQGQLLGVIGLHIFDKLNDVANVGYWMNTKFSGKGYCTQALKLLVKNTLKPLDLIRIEVIAAAENIASQKVAQNAGAQFEGMLKNRIRLRGIAVDANLYVFT